MKILMVGGSFDEEGGRSSGYFRKLAEHLKSALPDAEVSVSNGGYYADLLRELFKLPSVTHLLWFANVPNSLPKVQGLKDRHPEMTLVVSKNNRKNLYTHAQLFERMKVSDSDYLLEFTDSCGGEILGTLLGRGEQVIRSQCPDIADIAQTIALEFQNKVCSSPKKKVCLIGRTGPLSEALQARLKDDSGIELSLVSATEALAKPTLADESAVTSADLIVLCGQGLTSAELYAKLPENSRVLDVSPAFRVTPGWVYGMSELTGQNERIRDAKQVANPGCFATSAILALEPLQRAGLLNQPMVYLDAVGGYSTGGAPFAAKHDAGTLPPAATYSLKRRHLHLSEIEAFSGYPGSVWFTPKVADFAVGIRMQVPVFGVPASAALEVLKAAYSGTDVEVFSEAPSSLAADAWAGKPGAGLYVVDQDEGCLVICVMDNLRKGGADTALRNIKIMLSTKGD